MRCRISYYVLYLPISVSLITATSELTRSITQKDPCDDWNLTLDEFLRKSNKQAISSQAVDHSEHTDQHAEDKLVGGTFCASPEIPSVPTSRLHSSFPARYVEDPLAQQRSTTTVARGIPLYGAACKTCSGF
ncbi:hypothetical protein PCANC_25349 [Puccinia coronata f. sp. avenae]|uniref:Secreted protein n=1 Tax=Puccinia coronata f. sp. avenae TaxID=200324 RepID=A0A2N5S0L1_9BASI|nr:hypothetical protein PCANC_25349 [Puccinia coronata f. sp. avenae]